MPVSPTTPVVEQPRVIDAQLPVIDGEPNVMKVARCSRFPQMILFRRLGLCHYLR
jgi:hypothetical protein